ncbi:Uncharacterised protein [Yersinia pseudotuberculosis]|uniref:Uncharacterized protein n=1 Tax=Yersinia pseudotuberculosis serotype O:3 (strain YPIII) TaxID=502800 RepID=A0A0H3B696_YERPY|nr:hypothetical protein BZ22_3674 [Yersinia pseudotuberculosis YPIII]AYW89006.1 hypothetical protein EGX87_18510 [Yersinia pseudotuberculosis]CNC81870.1 Uncharacterised protein [Yersinia pseudotuberculosis]CNH81229.1 Uncharacterised protein [Yersinia pseudotuberculosis]
MTPVKKGNKTEENAVSVKIKRQAKHPELIPLLLEEIRFFGVEPRDVGRRCDDVFYGNIADRYTFVRFCQKNTEPGYGLPEKDYELTNIWAALQENDINNELQNRRKKRTESQAFSSGRRAENEVSSSKQKQTSRWSYQFKHPLLKDDKRIVKALLNDKKLLFAALQQHYYAIQSTSRALKKTLTLLPVSIFLRKRMTQQKAGFTYEQLKDHAAHLNTLFPEVLKKLRHRSPYSSFLGYSKLVMLSDTHFEPFLHVIFYLTEDNLSTWYAHDIGKAWCSVSDDHVDIHYYSFAGELPAPPAHMLNVKTDNEENLNYQVLYKDVLLPFPSEATHRDDGIEDKSVNELKGLIAKVEEKKLNKEKYSPAHLGSLKQQLKNITGMTDNPKNHLSYMAHVAKKYSKIPGVTSLTQSGKPIYNNQYSNEKYKKRKMRRLTEQECLDENAVPANFEEHLKPLNRGVSN